MEYTTLGDTGMEVSRICLGCMSFGSSDWREWVLDEEESMPIIDRAIELGINFFDTANMYSRGESERILGKALDGRRDEMVVATKGYFQMNEDDPNSGGLSRKAIEQELDNSRERLGMDTIDLYQIHRWDPDTPIETTMRALDDAVRREKVRYIGASSMWAHQFAEALYTSERIGLDRFVTMQNHYNLTYREEEREMLPLCEKEGHGRHPVESAGPRLPHPTARGVRGHHPRQDGRLRTRTPVRRGRRRRNQRARAGTRRREGRHDGPNRALVAASTRTLLTPPSSERPASNTWRRPSKRSTSTSPPATWSISKNPTNRFACPAISK